MTKLQKVLRALQRGQRLTPLMALKAGMGMRLGGQIYKLRAKGYDIRTTMVWKDGARVASYRLHKP